MHQPNHSLTLKQSLPFAAIAVLGVATLALGLALIVFAHYHERAYVFLGGGAAGFIGGVAGVVGAGSKVKAALSYGVIALGSVGAAVGLNYLVNVYGQSANQTRGNVVLIMSLVVVLAGIVGALSVQTKGGIVAISSVIMLGLIASLGLVALIVGVIYLIVLEHQGHAYLLLAVGAVCLIGGIACGILLQIRARRAMLG